MAQLHKRHLIEVVFRVEKQMIMKILQSMGAVTEKVSSDPLELKRRGNLKFKEKEFLEAISFYKKALDASNPKIPLPCVNLLKRNLFSKISQCYINL